jgi:hypothetical protein
MVDSLPGGTGGAVAATDVDHVHPQLQSPLQPHGLRPAAGGLPFLMHERRNATRPC